MGKKITGLIKQGKRTRATILALYGELGSGKTTFVQGLAKVIGVPHRILSPTFTIMREYPVQYLDFTRLFHIDLYQIKEVDNDTLGLSEIFANPRHLVVIEWAERLGNKLPKDHLDIYFEVKNQGRLIIVRNYE